MRISAMGAAITGLTFLGFWFWWGIDPLRPLPLFCGVGLLVLSVYARLRSARPHVSLAGPLAVLGASLGLGITAQVLAKEVMPSFWAFIAFGAVIMYAAYLNAKDSRRNKAPHQSDLALRVPGRATKGEPSV